MRRWAMMAMAGLMLASPTLADQPLRLTCMARVGGALNSPQVFELHPDGSLTLNDRVISSFEPTELSRTTDDDGPQISKVQHRWLVPNELLERKVLWIGEKNGTRVGMVEVYDFKGQRLLDGGKDDCHHDRYGGR